MNKKITVKPDDTITGFFKRIKQGDTYLFDPAQVNITALRVEASRQNKEARLLGQIQKREIRFSVSLNTKKGFIALLHK